MSEPALLSVDGIDSFYGGSHILHSVRMAVASGGRVSVLGRNGAGKSTLLKSIMNAGPRVTGAVAVDGRPLGSMPCFRRARLGFAFVPEDRRIFGHITTLENLRIAAFAARRDFPPPDPREVLRQFPMLVPLADRPGNAMSGGQQQMLAIARAVAARPRLLLLDEPTEGLAPVIVEELAATIRALCTASGVGLLLCEQHRWFAERCTDYVYVMASGRMVWEGDWAAFRRDTPTVQSYLAV